MDAHELGTPVEPAGTVSYAWASREFRVAAVRLSKQEPETEAHLVASGDAARLLIDLARLGASDELRQLLTPDPAESTPTWNVAYFEVGNLTPVDVREFLDPAEAIVAIADCADAEHAACELQACTDLGLRWNAVSRAHGRVLFQLPDDVTVTVGAADDESATLLVVQALLRWRERVAVWSAKDSSERGDVGSPLESDARVFAMAPSFDRRVAELEQRLLALETSVCDAIAGVSTRMSSSLAEFDGRFRERIDTVEQRLLTTVHEGVCTLADVDSAAPEVSNAAAARANVERVAVEVELCDEIQTVLTDLRDDVPPLTSEFVERLAAIGASVESELRRTSEVLGSHLELLRRAVTS